MAASRRVGESVDIRIVVANAQSLKFARATDVSENF